MEVLMFSGLPKEHIEVKNVVVGYHKGNAVSLHTVICWDGDEDKPTLVLVHGYGGSGALFYKIIRQLCTRFKLILVDLIGMGGSSRPSNFNENKLQPQETIDYFLDYMEEWRKVMKLEKFYLAAHSFGGYIMGNYALKYHQHIIKLLMLSPIGCHYDEERANLTDKEIEQKMQERFKGRKGPPNWVKAIAGWGWKKKISPFSMARFVGRK